jgi:hypothetical protein
MERVFNFKPVRSLNGHAHLTIRVGGFRQRPWRKLLSITGVIKAWNYIR